MIPSYEETAKEIGEGAGRILNEAIKGDQMNITINGHVNIFTDPSDDTYCHELEELLRRTLRFVPDKLQHEIKEVLK
jgi:hypothetical protein